MANSGTAYGNALQERLYFSASSSYELAAFVAVASRAACSYARRSSRHSCPLNWMYVRYVVRVRITCMKVCDVIFLCAKYI